MEPGLGSPTKLAGRVDRLGLFLLTLLLCVGWFYLLWNRIAPAVPAGCGLACLVLWTARLGEKRTLTRREAALRRRVGGELAVDSLLLQSPENAVNNVAAWLAREIPLTDFAAAAQGVLARHETGKVFVSCLQRTADAGRDEVLACVRHARREEADACVVCCTSGFTQGAAVQAEEVTPRTRLLGREALVHMAGRAAPATDEQLRALSKRRRRNLRSGQWRARILNPAKKRRYALYGLFLSLLYLLTRQVVYLIPGLICFGLFAFCPLSKKTKFTL